MILRYQNICFTLDYELWSNEDLPDFLYIDVLFDHFRKKKYYYLSV